VRDEAERTPLSFVRDGEPQADGMRLVSEPGLEDWISFPGILPQDEGFASLASADVGIGPDQLPRIEAVLDQVDDDPRARVAEARRRELSWDRMGAALGMKRQSAWERFPC
jgi:hypothetical protein